MTNGAWVGWMLGGCVALYYGAKALVAPLLSALGGRWALGAALGILGMALVWLAGWYGMRRIEASWLSLAWILSFLFFGQVAGFMFAKKDRTGTDWD